LSPPPADPGGPPSPHGPGGRPLHLRRFEIDRRPIAHVLLSRTWRQLALLALFVVFAAVVSLDPPTGLAVPGWRTVCIFGLCTVLWATALLPPAITSLLAMALVPLLGVMKADQAYSHFGSKVVFFLIGSLMLSAALIKSGLSARLATLVVGRLGKTPWRLVVAVYGLCAFASTLMSEHAVAVIMLPIVADIARALSLEKERSQLGKALSFALAWGCIIGGTLTVLGGSRGPLAIGLLEEATDGRMTVSFLDYIVASAPLVALQLVAGFILLRRFRSEVATTDEARNVLAARLSQMGKTTAREQLVGFIMLGTVVAWVIAGERAGLDVIAIVSVALLFAMRVVDWHDIETNVHWGVILMYGGALCVSAAMTETDAARWMTDAIFAGDFGSPIVLLFVVGVATAVLSEFMSNAAVVAMLLPPTLAIAKTLGIDPRAAAMAVVLPSNFSFVLPMSTPATAIGWSLGFYTPRQVATTGLTLHAVGFAAMLFLFIVWWPFLGII